LLAEVIGAADPRDTRPNNEDVEMFDLACVPVFRHRFPFVLSLRRRREA
jgi:hypothetical protein